jgi:hypothetical protein
MIKPRLFCLEVLHSTAQKAQYCSFRAVYSTVDCLTLTTLRHAAHILVMRSLAVLVIIGLVANIGSTGESVPQHVRYVVVGAGPGGLQIAHYLDSARRDYVLLEREAGPASFFERFPRFRQLISINKRFSGRAELDHAMRHDWNSLLSDPSHAVASGPVSSTDAALTVDAAMSAGWRLFRSYSDDYYPHADALVSYMRDWASGRAAAKASPANKIPSQRPTAPLRVRYNTSVSRVLAIPQHKGSARFPLKPRFRVVLTDGSELTCTFLILATGLQEPILLSSPSAAEAVSKGWIRLYQNASTNLSEYTGKRVLLLGRGNAAFEFANHLLEVTAAVHLVGSDSHRLRLAYETHYPVR